MSRELLKQALYALKYHSIQTRPIDLTDETIEALRQELAKPEQELRKEWVGLTDDEIKDILDCGRGGLVDIKKAEQILKDKNT
jgi:hypothetical protein